MDIEFCLFKVIFAYVVIQSVFPTEAFLFSGSRRRRRRSWSSSRYRYTPKVKPKYGGSRNGKYPDCNFTYGLGGWANHGSVPWLAVNHTLRNSGVSLAGRQGDGDGYALVDFNHRNYKSGVEAKMYSHKITGPACMRFFYYLNGGETGFLKIMTKVQSGWFSTDKQVFYRYGDHGPRWQSSQIYLSFRDNGVYQVIISGRVGNTSTSNLAIDDISFTNDTCDHIPQDHRFNCTFANSRCGWTTKGGSWSVVFGRAINQYVSSVYGRRFADVALRSPRILEYEGCFRFQYQVKHRYNSNIGESKLFVFVVDENKQMLPVWSTDLRQSGWRTAEIRLNIRGGFSQVVLEGISLYYETIYFANFVLHPSIDNCKGVDEKTFYVSRRLSDSSKFIISSRKQFCDTIPVSQFTAGVIPSVTFPKPIFIHSGYNNVKIKDRNYNGGDNLIDYFYTGTAPQSNGSEVYYTLDFLSYVLSFQSSSLTNSTDKVFFVKQFENYEDITYCPRGWTEIAGKCFKLICGFKSWWNARQECFKANSDLASLDVVSVPLVGQYLESIKVRAEGYTKVSIGLTFEGMRWLWLDGRENNQTIGSSFKVLGLALSFWLSNGWSVNTRLAWNGKEEWKINAELYRFQYKNSLHLCQKVRVNHAFRSTTSQSSTKLVYSSDLAVDSQPWTCSLTMQSHTPSWWQVRFTNSVKIFLVKLSSSSMEGQDVSLHAYDDALNVEKPKVSCRKRATVNQKTTPIICEPPMDGSYVKVQTIREESVSLCEVEVFGLETLRDITGVSRDFWGSIRGNEITKLKKNRNYPSHPDFSHAISNFDPPKNIASNYGQVLQAYYLPQVGGRYTFFLTGSDDVEFYISPSRETKSLPLLSILGQKQGLKAYQWDGYPSKQNTSQFLQACQFYFLKVLMKEGYDDDHVSLGVQHPDGSYERPMSGKNLFWVLPGKLQVRFAVTKDTVRDVTLGRPFKISGTYNSYCTGIFCGNCPLAIFLTFAGYFECIILSSSNAATNDTLSLNLNNWFSYPGDQKILMGYQKNGNCSLISATTDLNFESNVIVSQIGILVVKPILLVSCHFESPQFCTNVDHVRTIGWARIQRWNDNSGYAIVGEVKATNFMSLNWIEVDRIVEKTGICVKFSYMLSGDNNTLSSFVQPFSGTRTQVWRLRGNHGNTWHEGYITLRPSEKFVFDFEGTVSSVNNTAAIAAVTITTESCPTRLHPTFASPGHSCLKDQFQCDNDVCIKSSLACNGDKNCVDGSDEKYCKCLSEQFQCKLSGGCVSVRKVCDNVKDCEDGTDEEHCYTPCINNEFYCPSGECIPWSKTCNGLWDCMDGADEPEICGISRQEKRNNTKCNLNDLGCKVDSENIGFCGYSDGNCNFEHGFCDWRQAGSDSDDFDWSINAGETSSLGTGPAVDHTTDSNKGKYTFIEASSPRVAGDAAHLVGGPFRGAKVVCFTLFYHMFGDNIGRLNIYKTSLNETVQVLLWTRSGPQGDAWKQAQFNIKTEKDYKILIEGIRGNGMLGDIAVDDISMVDKDCSDVDRYDSPPFCSFETTCNWKMDNRIWRSQKIATGDPFILGDYCLLTRQSSNLSTTVPRSMARKFQCVSIWYKYNPSCMGMNFYFLQMVDGHAREFTFVVSNRKEAWRFAEIPLQRSLEYYRIELNVTIPSKSPEICYLSIDEINFSVESCTSSQQDLSSKNTVLCPDDTIRFRSSCYKFNSMKRSWIEATKSCELEKGATLVSLNDKEEENFVMTSMKSLLSKQFWIGLREIDEDSEGNYEWSDKSLLNYTNWIDSGGSGVPGTKAQLCAKVIEKGWTEEECSERHSFVCEYRLAPGSCDFEANICNWETGSSNMNGSQWHRDMTQRNQTKNLARWQSEGNAYVTQIYVSEYRQPIGGILELDIGKDTRLLKFTLCIWLYVYADVTEATVITYGGVDNLKISYNNKSNFMITLQGRPVSTKVPVSPGVWQHICLALDATTLLWSFYKDGSLVDFGLSHVFPEAANNKILVGGQTRCLTKLICQTVHQLLGKFTEPTMWSRVLLSHEVSMISTGCGIVFHGDIVIWERSIKLLKEIAVSHGECIPGKGYKITFRKDNLLSSDSTSTLVSPWMENSRDNSRGVCMIFAYRLLGELSEIKLSVQPRNRSKEIVWHIKNVKTNTAWKYGQVFLGLPLEFRVFLSATLITNHSEASVDNIFFKRSFCDPIPPQTQGSETYIINSTSGFLTSPYYPFFYQNNMRRVWKILAPPGHRISLKFLHLNLEEDPQCNADFLEFHDGTRSTEVVRYCGSILPQDFVTQTNVFLVTFISNEKRVGTGFKIHYKSVDAESLEDHCEKDTVPKCPTSVRCHRMSSNRSKVFLSAQELLVIPSFFPESTSAIDFDGSSLVKLTNADFENLTQLEFLSLRKNQIVVIEGKAFQDLVSLKTLRLSRNFLEEIPRSLFHETRSLEILDLSLNKITKLDVGLFLFTNNTRVLSLRLNELKMLENGVFDGLRNLQYLYLDGNSLSSIHGDVFDGLGSLKVLILKDNSLRVLKASWFNGMHNLQILNIRNNKLERIEPGTFDSLKDLVELDLSKNHLQSIPENLFQSLGSLKSVKVDHFTLCCYAKQGNPNVDCLSKDKAGFSNCDELLKNKVLKYSIWVLGVMAFAGNLVVILWRIIAKDSNRVSSFLLTNLAVADFLMGLYMLIIAYKDTVWQGVYFKHDIAWRASDLCVFAGVVSTLSSEVSVLTLSVITLDRMICIVFPFRFRRISMRKATIIVIFVWLLGFGISLAPLFKNDYFYDYVNQVHFFGRSAVCLPMQLSNERPAGWEYSVSIFIILNGLSFLYILVAYLVMYHTITKVSGAVRSTRMNQESTLAKRMMFIILTDFFCWFPVIIISILTTTGHLYDPRKQVYVWIAVFVLPINSAINPLLYTFSTPFVRKTLVGHNRFSRLSVMSRSRRRNGRGWNRAFTTSSSFQTNLECTNTIEATILTPDPRRKLEAINEGFMLEEMNSESHFTESGYCIRLLEDIELFTTGNKIKKSLIALEEDDKEKNLCLVQVYGKDQEETWKDTTKILSWLALDGGHINILPFLWSAKANQTLVKNGESERFPPIEMEDDDCIICHELPSKQTLQDFLVENKDILTVSVVYMIAKDLIHAVEYLSSKNIVHNALVPCNVLITGSLQSPPVTAILGGFHDAGFSNPSSDEDEQVNNENQNKIDEHCHDLKCYGIILKILLKNCPEAVDLSLLHETMVCCLSEDNGSKPTAFEIMKKIESMDSGDLAPESYTYTADTITDRDTASS